MYDVLDFVQDITPVRSDVIAGVLAHNRLILSDIAAYRNLVDGWDEDGAVAPAHQTIVAAFDIALLLTVAEQPIYHTSPGPVGEIMINLRNGPKSVELLLYPGDRRKFVCLSPDELPQQGPLTPDSLHKTLLWLNQ